IKWGDPVVVHRPHSYAYKPAHIREIVSGRYMIWYDDGSYIYQTKNDIRVFNKSIVCNEPAYLGCFRDHVPRYLTIFIPTRPATVGACVDMCNAQGYSIAALRNSDLCFCGNAYNKGYQTESKRCDMPCFDNPFEICGGVYTFSQYWTGTSLLCYFVQYVIHAITKAIIPRYGKLPWRNILQARKGIHTPMSLADSSPWRWNPSTSSWQRSDGKQFRWNKNGKFSAYSLGTSTTQAPVNNKWWKWNGRTWIIAPRIFRYLGCFADDYERDLPFSVFVYPLTTRSCILKCRSHRYSVAGIQRSSQCFCGNSYNRYGRVREEQCNMKCAASPSGTCGGVLRNSLYFTGIGSAWPKGTESKKPAGLYYSSKPQKATLPSGHALTIKVPGQLTSVVYNKVPTPKAKEKLTSSGSHTNNTLRVKTKSVKKTKGRNKIINHPAKHQLKDFDDYRVESIKVKLNFSELKKALETMSPAIVRRVQQDLARINNLEKKKHILHTKNKVRVELDESEGEPAKSSGGKPIDYRKEMEKIRKKIDKVALERLTNKNMKDIMEIMKIPKSMWKVKSNVVRHKNVFWGNHSNGSSSALKGGEGNVAHEEIESYAKISLDFPWKTERTNAEETIAKKDNLQNKYKKQGKTKNVAKKIKSVQKDAGKKLLKIKVVKKSNDGKTKHKVADLKSKAKTRKLGKTDAKPKIIVKPVHKFVRPITKQVKPVFTKGRVVAKSLSLNLKVKSTDQKEKDRKENVAKITDKSSKSANVLPDVKRNHTKINLKKTAKTKDAKKENAGTFEDALDAPSVPAETTVTQNAWSLLEKTQKNTTSISKNIALATGEKNKKEKQSSEIKEKLNDRVKEVVEVKENNTLRNRSDKVLNQNRTEGERSNNGTLDEAKLNSTSETIIANDTDNGIIYLGKHAKELNTKEENSEQNEVGISDLDEEQHLKSGNAKGEVSADASIKLDETVAKANGKASKNKDNKDVKYTKEAKTHTKKIHMKKEKDDGEGQSKPPGKTSKTKKSHEHKERSHGKSDNPITKQQNITANKEPIVTRNNTEKNTLKTQELASSIDKGANREKTILKMSLPVANNNSPNTSKLELRKANVDPVNIDDDSENGVIYLGSTETPESEKQSELVAASSQPTETDEESVSGSGVLSNEFNGSGKVPNENNFSQNHVAEIAKLQQHKEAPHIDNKTEILKAKLHSESREDLEDSADMSSKTSTGEDMSQEKQSSTKNLKKDASTSSTKDTYSGEDEHGDDKPKQRLKEKGFAGSAAAQMLTVNDSSYVYFGQGKHKGQLPLIRQDDLKRLLKQRENAMKRSNAYEASHPQNSSETFVQNTKDEEEAVYQQEEKEREQEIRNLIINELDDNLLDDDNASFSSHDFRSTSNSRTSQQLDNSDLQPKDNDWNSAEFADFPPRRGVFEKPALMTARATNFVTQIGGDANEGVAQRPADNYTGYDQGSSQANTPQFDDDNYEYQEYEDFGSYHGNSTDSNGQDNNNMQYDKGYKGSRQNHNYDNIHSEYNNGDGYQIQGVDTGYNHTQTEFNQEQGKPAFHDEHQGMVVSLAQSQQITNEKQHDAKTIQDKLNSALKNNELLKEENMELLDKFNAANSTIDCLNEQLVQLSRADSLAKVREQHESILNTVRKRQEDEILRLKQKLDDNQVSLNWKTEEANRLRDEVMEKADIINRLNRTLDDSQRQCQELLKTGTVTEITNLRTQLQDTISAKSKLDLNCTSLKNEVSGLKEELSMYQNALKYGFGDQHNHSQSAWNQSVVRNLNNENWATPKTYGNDKQADIDAINGLRKELEHSLSLNQTKSQTIKDLENALEGTAEKLEEEKKRAGRIEKIVVEQEVKVNDLKAQLQSTKMADRSEHVDSSGDTQTAFQELQQEYQDLKERFVEIEANEQELSEDNLNLKTQMAEMVAEYDEDKRICLEKCRDACLQLHEDAKDQLRIDLQEEKEQTVKALRDALEESNDELVRVQECYLELSEESRTIEMRVREEVREEMKQDKSCLSQDESKAIEAARTVLAKQHQTEMEKAREQWKKEHDIEVVKTLKEQTKKIKEQANEEKVREIRKAVNEAETKWHQRETTGQLENQLATAKIEWIKEQEKDMIKRISQAVNEASKTWREHENKTIQEHVQKAVHETKRILMESRDREIAQALLEARATWQSDEEETRQSEIEHEVEVAVTNAIAEAKQQWDKNNTSNVSGRVLSLAIFGSTKKPRATVIVNLEERQNSIDAAVAIAEVKWLEHEQTKISRAVDTAVQALRASWAHEKTQATARAVADARQQWKAGQDQELSQALEDASAQLVDKFEEQKREAVEMALREAKTLWQRNHDQNNNTNLEAIRNKLWSEFEETKRQEFQETIEEERNNLLEERNNLLQEHEEQKQDEINRAIMYLEDQYAKGLEEFKHKELRNALAEARADWEKEQESDVEQILKKRVDTAREEWFKTLDHSSRTEVDRALATAREAWAAEYEDELEDRVNAEVDRVRETLGDELENMKRKEIDEAVRKCRKQFEVDERKLKDELNRLKILGSSQSLRQHYENEISRLSCEHQGELDHLREEYDEHTRIVREDHDEHTRIVRESVEEEFDQKLVAVLHDAKQVWEEEQEEDRIQVEDQHKQKIKAVLENARQQFLKDQEKAVNTATEAVTNRHKELLKAERETHKSTLERMKGHLTKTKQQHESDLQRVESKHAKELQNLKVALSDKIDSGTQTPPKQNSHSICDSSFGSIDQLTAVRTMHELRDSYLDTVAKIRDDVLDHVNQTKTNAAKKIRNEVLKERHSTAKKLRRHYLQCLKQLLEEDKACAETSKTPSTVEEKLERMNKVLNALSPEPPPKGTIVPTHPSLIDDNN
ncbi:hypothetical protein QZH41_015858, partial [Actinostola sp. cb2023]